MRSRKVSSFIRRTAGFLWKLIAAVIKILLLPVTVIWKTLKVPVQFAGKRINRRKQAKTDFTNLWTNPFGYLKSVFTLKYFIKRILLSYVLIVLFCTPLAAIGFVLELQELNATQEIQIKEVYPDAKLDLEIPLLVTGISPIFTPEVQRWAPWILRWAAEYNADPNAIATLIQIESCGGHLEKSGAGAEGLMQVMPFHFAKGEDHFDPSTNAKRGISYFKERLEASGGDVEKAFAQYNGGPRAADPKNRVAETRTYVKWATGIYADAVEGKTHSDTVDAWLEAGGKHMCQRTRRVPIPAAEATVTAWTNLGQTLLRWVEKLQLHQITVRSGDSERTVNQFSLREDAFNSTRRVPENIAVSLENIPQTVNALTRSITGMPSGECYTTGNQIWPTGGTLTQNYHAGHHGIDIGISTGTELPSVRAGTVAYAGWSEAGYGNLVIVDDGARQTYYGHLSKVWVRTGQVVSVGDIVGLSGSTGNSSGPHLHWEERVNWERINPLSNQAQLSLCKP